MNAIRIVIASALITAAVIKGAPALAEPTASEVNVSIVATADLDLATRAGQRTLDERLVHAASEVCATASDVDLAGKNQVRACRASVLAEARSRGQQLVSRETPIVVAAR